MDEKKFSEVKLDRNSPKWEKCISREGTLYENKGELREIFERNYNRILHSQAYRRLKHKTQVFL